MALLPPVYLYRQAVIAHETGVPMMRPMFMEYPQDRSCHNLDLQYMMGDSLLVAPVFHEDGTAEYYLPKGKWVNLLTGQTLDGSCWHQGKFDYHSLPLMVAPNTILPMGSCHDKPDYDYSSGVTLCLSYFEDGAASAVQIPDLQGNTVMTVSAHRQGDVITLKVQGGGSWQCRMLADADADIVYSGSTAEIHLK